MYASWLSRHQDSRLLDLPVIIGSHNSASAFCGSHVAWWKQLLYCYARQQEASIRDQLLMGVRFFDFRLHHVTIENQASVYVSHSLDSKYSLNEALAAIRVFLEEFPTEFVIVYARIDHWFRNDGDDNHRAGAIQQILIEQRDLFCEIQKVHQLDTVRVRDIGGKVCLMIPDNGSVVPSPASSDICFLDSQQFYSVVDVWKTNSVFSARSVIDRFMSERGRKDDDGEQASVLRGVCLDLTVGAIPPSCTSPSLNWWFVDNLCSNANWLSPAAKPLGILLLDFVDDELMRKIFSLCYSDPTNDTML